MTLKHHALDGQQLTIIEMYLAELSQVLELIWKFVTQFLKGY